MAKKKRRIKIDPKMRKVYVASIVFLAVIYLFYGYFKGRSNLQFSADVSAIINESAKTWTASTFVKSDGTIDLGKDLNFYRKMKDISSNSKEKARKLRPTVGGIYLKQKTIDYYRISEKISTNSITISEYALKIDKVKKDLESQEIQAADPLGDFAKWREMMAKDISDLEKTKPKPSFREFHESLIDKLKGLSSIIENLTKAVEAKDTAKIEAEKKKLADFKIESPTVLSEDILNDIVSEQELERLVSLEKDIKKMTEDLKHRKVEWL